MHEVVYERYLKKNRNLHLPFLCSLIQTWPAIWANAVDVSYNMAVLAVKPPVYFWDVLWRQTSWCVDHMRQHVKFIQHWKGKGRCAVRATSTSIHGLGCMSPQSQRQPELVIMNPSPGDSALSYHEVRINESHIWALVWNWLASTEEGCRASQSCSRGQLAAGPSGPALQGTESNCWGGWRKAGRREMQR